ncbi:MAG: anaerobic glycerol-3-phosphate dehydrogenase subunit GlpA [Aggregatilineales bacterium]
METDVLVIGGGATGGGIAWDLALRGVRVILAEMGDLATGTSGRYHGLLHSGGRYAVRDPESARECIEENFILRRVAPESIEDTGGFFVLCPDDDEAYVDEWLAGCAAAGIPTRELQLAEALRREPRLNRGLRAVYEVPDGTCDSWDLLHGLQKGAHETGRATFLTYHRVETFLRDGARITGARLVNLRTGESLNVSAAITVNAAGPWAAELGRKAGASFNMKLSRGAMLAYNIRWVNTVINKLRQPGDGDIFVPVGTVSVIGTTSVITDDPGDFRVEPWEVERILAEAEAMTPGISGARILRAWGGVRPLYDPGETAEGRAAKRTFTTIDHAQTDGVEGFISIIGGKLTTFRRMAEQVSDLVCAKLGVAAPCLTAETPLPSLHGKKSPQLHELRARLKALEHGELHGSLICECEVVTAPQICAALDEAQPGRSDVVSLNDLRRDLRLGMGPCQGGFCAYRAAAVRHIHLNGDPHSTRALLEEFIERRLGGMRPLLWGHNLRQALLAEHLYRRVIGLPGEGEPIAHEIPNWSGLALNPEPLPHSSSHRPRVVVVGAGLAGLVAALAAAEQGARVELVAHGQGALALHPGWIETGAVAALAGQPQHPYHHAAESLAYGLALLDRVVPLTADIDSALTAIGLRRPVALGAGGALARFEPGQRLLVVGITGWRDFYARLIADTLRESGTHAAAIDIDLPHRGGNFDDWPVDYAHYLDTVDGMQHLLASVRPRLDGATLVAFPAILGFHPETRRRIAEGLGCPILEIPTLPPSIPGMRIQRALHTALRGAGVRLTFGPRARVELCAGRAEGVALETASGRPRHLPADAVILATGGLFGGGLESDMRGSIYETTANLPVSEVPPRDRWFTEPLLAAAAQPIHFAGISTDAALRPLNDTGKPVASNLYAAGRLLGGYSPVIEGCTEGVDIASGAHAGRAAITLLADRAAQTV